MKIKINDVYLKGTSYYGYVIAGDLPERYQESLRFFGNPQDVIGVEGDVELVFNSADEPIGFKVTSCIAFTSNNTYCSLPNHVVDWTELASDIAKNADMERCLDEAVATAASHQMGLRIDAKLGK